MSYKQWMTMCETYGGRLAANFMIIRSQRRLSRLFRQQIRITPTMNRTPPTASRMGPAILSGFSPMDVLPGQWAMIVIVRPMNTIPRASTCTRKCTYSQAVDSHRRWLKWSWREFHHISQFSASNLTRGLPFSSWLADVNSKHEKL